MIAQYDTIGVDYANLRKADPRAYLNPHIRKGISTLWKMQDAETGLARLAADLDSGSWEARYGELLKLDELDAGYRLIVA
jgi:hypothetical protein